MSGGLWGEIDTKPIESLRTALTMFEDKGDQNHKKYQAKTSVREFEKELEELSKEFANCKVRLEAKNAAYMQALLKVEHYQKMTCELSILLKKSDIERNKYKSISAEAKACMDEHESKMKEMADQLLENEKVRKQFLHVLSELKATRKDLLNKETQFAAARDSQLKALSQAEKMETASNTGKGKKELLLQVKDLNEAIHISKHAAIREEKDKYAMLSEKVEKIESATIATSQAKKQLEHMRMQVEIMQGSMEREFIDMEQKEKQIMGQNVYIRASQTELNCLKKELMDAKKEVNGLNINIESLTDKLQKSNAEMNMIKEREAEVEKEEKQNHRIKQRENGVTDKSGNPSQVSEISRTDHLRPEFEDRNFDNDNDCITIPLREYKSLIREARKLNEVPASVVEVGSQSELAHVKKQLEVSAVKNGELRARAEQALSRAESAEKAKAALDDKLKRAQERRERRRAALAALKEESTPNPFSPSSSDATPTSYQILGKVLNIKL